MGMDVTIWSNPSEARVLGGKYPVRALLRRHDTEMRTAFTDLEDLGYSVLSWSQRRPAGPIEIAVTELTELVDRHREYTGDGIILVAHSRGGLVARKYLERQDGLIRGLITLATPHRGTTMARWAVHISPLASLMHQLLQGSRKKDLDSAFRRVLRFLSSDGLRELLPDSPFYASLRDAKQKNTRYASLGGTDPDLIRIGGFSMPDLMGKVIPGKIIPEEIRVGYGDGMVSASSAVHPYADIHHNFSVNHASILFDRDVRSHVCSTVESL
jgi:pimeloyl-ACP methyl ester carboxylesterase